MPMPVRANGSPAIGVAGQLKMMREAVSPAMSHRRTVAASDALGAGDWCAPCTVARTTIKRESLFAAAA
jgi:hypothetical protein